MFKTEACYFTKEALNERLNDQKHTIYIAETDNGDVVGYALLELYLTEITQNTLTLTASTLMIFCVLKSHQRNGIGKNFLSVASKKLKRRTEK